MSPSRDSPTLQPRFLVVSLGNPPPHHQSHHSAGHVALAAAQQLLGSAQPDFASTRLGKKLTKASMGLKYIFLQSPTQMNETGPWLAKAYREILVQEDLDPSELGVVVVHDDLEHSLGAVNTLSWKKSHQGHNGVRSIMNSLPRRSTEAPWVRIAIGIGRPVGRDVKTVSEYVMSSFSKRETELLNEKSEEVLEALEELEEEWLTKGPMK
ncbi:peptidyl-tRNA hydrolase [Coniochaeta sp. PMI_546]|nr:peptidyl-tRNA hydrolase [Coniochaeta sp. PMI_546]